MLNASPRAWCPAHSAPLSAGRGPSGPPSACPSESGALRGGGEGGVSQRPLSGGAQGSSASSLCSSGCPDVYSRPDAPVREISRPRSFLQFINSESLSYCGSKASPELGEAEGSVPEPVAGTRRRAGGHPGGRVRGARSGARRVWGRGQDPERRARGPSRPGGHSPGICCGAFLKTWAIQWESHRARGHAGR